MLHLLKSAKHAEEAGDIRGVSRALSNLGVEFARTSKFDSALKYFDRAITVQTEMNDLDGLATSLMSRGKNYIELGKYQRAKQDCNDCLEMTFKSGALNLQKEAYECLADASEYLGELKNALQYRKEFFTLKDSLFNKEKTQEMTRAEMNFQFEKQQLADQLEFQKAINDERDKLFIVLVIGFVIVAAMLFLYWKYAQNLKYKRLENKMLTADLEHQKNDLTNFAVKISNSHSWADRSTIR